MKILHVIIGLGAGGAEHMLRRLVESHRGTPEFQHCVVSLTDSGELGDVLQSAGVVVKTLDMRGVFNAPIILLRLIQVIRQQRPDVIQTWMYHADLLGGLAAKAAGRTRIIWGVRNTDMIKGTAYSTFAIRRVCAFLSRCVPSVIVCAAEASRTSHVAIGYDASKMLVIPNGFEGKESPHFSYERKSFRAECGWSDQEIVVGCIGRFNHYKDHANFIRAAGLLARRFSAVRFLMIGHRVDSQNDELCRLIADSGFAARFKLLGFRRDVQFCLGAMDVFCLSSRSEGFPNVVGEAMSMGIPCVATDVGDVRLLVSDTGVIVPKEDATALCAGIVQIIEMPSSDRAKMVQRARERIISQFSMATARERFESLYKSLCETAPKAVLTGTTDSS